MPDNTKTPHDNWALFYDTVYERQFGLFYNQWTQNTLAVIRELTPAGGRIIDYGAGTGRLALPLAADGYEVVAVEPSAPMARQIEAKATEQGIVCPEIRVQSMGTDALKPPADTAVCVFTVINYVTSTLGLKGTFARIARSLRLGGHLLLDVTQKGLFQSYDVRVPGLERHVELIPHPGSTHFDYRETTTVEIDGQSRTYRDAFPLCFWPREMLELTASWAHLEFAADVTQRIPGAGAEYIVLRKTR